MATIIAARKPYYLTRYTPNLVLNITSNRFETPSETGYYEVYKSGQYSDISKDLSINLSPFGHDMITQTINTLTPTGIEAPTNSGRVDMVVDGNITVPESYTAYDGWVVYGPGVLGLTDPTNVKYVTLDTNQYITGNLNPILNIKYTTNHGSTVTLSNSFYGVNRSSVFPVIPPSLTTNDNTRTIKIEGLTTGNVLIWELNYEVICPYDLPYTVGYINRYGVWEFIDFLGARKSGLEITKEKYVRYDEGVTQNYLTNARRTMSLNSGWVNEDFKTIVEDLLVSENVVLYTGDITTSIKLICLETSTDIKQNRVEKMINYQFKFEEAGTVIPIV